MPKVSIIIPTYNSANTIAETIASVQQQSITDYEIIVIDDGSQDNTIDVVKSIIEPRLKLFPYQNGGVAIARNRGIDRATGEYIAFLDADDLWSPDKLASQIEALDRHPQAKVAYSWVSYMDEQGKALFSGTPFTYQGDVYPQLLQTNFLTNASNILVHRDVLNTVTGFNPQLAYTADWDFYLRLAKNFKFAVVPQYQIFYRQCANSMSTKVEQLKEECLWYIDRVYQTAAKELSFQKNKSYSILHLYCADLYRKKINGDNRKSLVSAMQNLRTSILLDPKSILKIDTQRLLIKLLWFELYFTPPVQFFAKLRYKL